MSSGEASRRIRTASAASPRQTRAGGPTGHPDHTGWSDSSARAVLQLMVESVAEMIGFEVAALSVILDGELVTMAYTGPPGLEEYLSQTDPVGVLDPVLARAATWGRFRFLAGEEYDGELEGHWVTTVTERSDHPEAWRPEDVLIGLLADDDGRLVGVLSVDKPVSGRRPAEHQRRLLERYAAQAERAVLTAFEREQLVQRIAHAESARRLVRSASIPARASLEEVLHHTHRPLVEGFGASGSWIQVFEAGTAGRGHARSRDGADIEISPALVELAGALAPRLWADQRVLVIADGAERQPPTSADPPGLREQVDLARRHLGSLGLASVLAVPLGAGPECLGFLALGRRVGDPPWSGVEVASAEQIGHDLGASLVTARALERERNLVRELRQLDDYRNDLVAALSHELRTPLTVIAGNLELLGGVDLDDEGSRFRDAMRRGTHRMQKVVDDLMVLARVSHPTHPLVALPVDLAAVVAEVVALVEVTAQAKGLRILVEVDERDVVVRGDASELDRMLSNLVSNAVKYTAPGGTVRVVCTRRGDDVVLEVADDGIGISPEDQAGLFRAFFRTSNPAALREPGTGLGLATVAVIVERHCGTILTRSALGVGTTFAVTLPARCDDARECC